MLINPSLFGSFCCLSLVLWVAGCTQSGNSDKLADQAPPAVQNTPSSNEDDKAGKDSAAETELEASEPEASEPGASEPGAPKLGAAKKPEPKKSSSAPQISSEAFRMAAYDGRLDSVRSAIESGIDVNGIDPAQKLTALHMAAYNGHTETVKYLIEKGATVDCRDAEGKTPLIHACTGPFAKAVEALIEAGADVNARDSTEGFTPLMMAAGLGQPDVVSVLLKHDADKSLLDDDKESAADHAKNSGHSDIVEMLK